MNEPDFHEAVSRKLWGRGRLGKRGGGAEVVFGQVHEDPVVELELLAQCPKPARVFCIASGGCTAFSLMTQKPRSLCALDINPAQIFLLELKRAALQNLPDDAGLSAFVSDARPAYETLRPLLSDEARRFWDKRRSRLRLGLNRCGLIELKLHQAMRLFYLLVFSRKSVEAFLQHGNLSRQIEAYRRDWDVRRWRALFRVVFNAGVLRLWYGKAFLQTLPKNWGALLKKQLEEAFLRFPAQRQRFLWQLFLGTYPPDCLPFYLQPQAREDLREGLARSVFALGDAVEFLRAQPEGFFDFFALSNILEVTTPAYARELLDQIERTAAAGARVCARFIFPDRLDPRSLGPKLVWQPQESLRLQALDTSIFCKRLLVFHVEGPA